jgi:hypothetical protein
VVIIGINENDINDKALLNISEFCAYLGIGETKARELLKAPRNGFSMQIGSKWYAHKVRLDQWLLKQCDKY